MANHAADVWISLAVKEDDVPSFVGPKDGNQGHAQTCDLKFLVRCRPKTYSELMNVPARKQYADQKGQTADLRDTEYVLYKLGRRNPVIKCSR